MSKKCLSAALPLEGDDFLTFLALPLWWSSMPDSRGYRLCALRQREIPMYKKRNAIDRQRKQSRAIEQQDQPQKQLNSNSNNCLFREFTLTGKCQKVSKNVKKKLWGPIFWSKYPPPPKMVIFPLYKRLNVHFFPPAPLSIVGRRREKKYWRLIAP